MQQFQAKPLKEYAHENDASLLRHQRIANRDTMLMSGVCGASETGESKTSMTIHHHRADWLAAVIPIVNEVYHVRHHMRRTTMT